MSKEGGRFRSGHLCRSGGNNGWELLSVCIVAGLMAKIPGRRHFLTQGSAGEEKTPVLPITAFHFKSNTKNMTNYAQEIIVQLLKNIYLN